MRKWFFLDFCVSIGCLNEDLYGFDIAEDLMEDMLEKKYTVLNNKQISYFDYIFLWDVIEHIPNPKAFLQGIQLYLKIDGGKIIVQTPRVGILSDLFRDKWEHFLPQEHVILYTRESLVQLFNDAGFLIKKASSFVANAPASVIPQPYKSAYDQLAKQTDNGSSQLACFALKEVR